MEKTMKKEVQVPQEKFEKFVVHTAVYYTKLTKKYKSRKPYEPVDPRHIVSQIPGIIRKVFVKKGQNVQKGQILFELEAMKMYNKIMSPLDGIVKAIHIKEGDKIPKNFLVIEMK